MAITDDGFETSEFSKHELLYVGSLTLTLTVDLYIDPATRDPFDIVAEREEHAGVPITHWFYKVRSSDM